MDWIKSIFLLIIMFNLNILGLLAQNTMHLQSKNAPTPCLNKDFSVVVHLVSDTTGTFMEEDSVRNMITEVDSLFDPGCIGFQVCEINKVGNWQFDTLNKVESYQQLLTEQRQEGRINIFFVSTADFAEEPCGFGSFEGIKQDTGAILIYKSEECTAKDIAHFIGHYFGLMDTFGEGIDKTLEKVDGSSCDTEGDLICDTPADPFTIDKDPANYVDVENGCRFTNTETDADGEYYDPDVGNIMSRYDASCKCRFSNDQYQLMIDNFFTSVRKSW